MGSESNWRFRIAEAGMSHGEFELLARSLTVPYRYAAKFRGLPGTRVIDIDTSPFTGQWQWFPVVSAVPGPFPGPYAEDVELD